jgi:hypothetical protein
MGKAITLPPMRMGYLFSAFSWAYGLNQQSQSAEYKRESNIF